MIRVAQPAEPEGYATRAEDELVANRDRNGRNEKLKFAAYGRPEVRDTLNKTFSFKCAYCESFFGGTQPVAIEHFRPKGKITLSAGDERTPGYWWLAAKWPNLLPSCTDCNSARRQMTVSGSVLMGKGNWFPLADEQARARGEGQEFGEQPLLLHPYFDKPDAHLRFLADGLVVPRRSRAQGESLQGHSSITVYALLRPQLVQARRWHAERFLHQLDVVEREARRLESTPGDAEQEEVLRVEIAELKKFLAPDQPFVGMVRQLLKTRRVHLAGRWQRLLRA